MTPDEPRDVLFRTYVEETEATMTPEERLELDQWRERFRAETDEGPDLPGVREPRS
jgi:hypothetical protein